MLSKQNVGRYNGENVTMIKISILSYFVMFALVLFIFVGVEVSVSQYLFLVLSVVAPAALLLNKRLADYIVFCVVLFLIVPFVRRLVDYHLGYSAVSLIMMAPYLASSLSIPALVSIAFSNRIRFPLAFSLVLVAASYGYFIAIFEGHVLAGTFDFLRWALPPCVALLIVFNPDEKQQIYSKLATAFILFVPLISLYGYYQFVHLPTWDALWMLNSRITSIGQPLPYQVRVFSTLNSPGSCGVILMFGMLLCLGAKSFASWLSPAFGVVGLALTLFRSAWLSLAIGLLYVLFLGPVRVRIMLIIGAVGISIAMPALLVATGTEEIVSRRFETLFALDRDASALVRSAQYDQFAERLENNPIGTGFGEGFYTAKAGEGNNTIIDSGPVEIFSVLGILFGALYLGSILYLTISLLFVRVSSDYIGCKAILLSFTVLLWSATSSIGEMGFMMWLAVGLLMPNIYCSSVERRSKSPPTMKTELPSIARA